MKFSCDKIQKYEICQKTLNIFSENSFDAKVKAPISNEMVFILLWFRMHEKHIGLAGENTIKTYS